MGLSEKFCGGSVPAQLLHVYNALNPGDYLNLCQRKWLKPQQVKLEIAVKHPTSLQQSLLVLINRCDLYRSFCTFLVFSQWCALLNDISISGLWYIYIYILTYMIILCPWVSIVYCALNSRNSRNDLYFATYFFLSPNENWKTRTFYRK